MKKKKWIEERKSVLLKDLVHQMLLAKVFFEDLYGHYKKSGHCAFQNLEQWIGTEGNKGSLWNLKDNSHVLFRDTISQQRFYENIFDWTLGSIFHEGMKLKEDIYVIEVYQNWENVFAEGSHIPHGVNLKELREEYKLIIKRAKESAAHEMENLSYLFIKAMDQLQKIIVQNKNDGLLIRFLIETEDLFNHAYGKEAFKKLCAGMYEQGLTDAYLKGGENYREGGWYHEALKVLTEALKLTPNHKKTKKEYDLIQEKLRNGE